MKAVSVNIWIRYEVKNTQGARRKPVASPASKFTIKSCDKQRKSIKNLKFKNLKMIYA